MPFSSSFFPIEVEIIAYLDCSVSGLSRKLGAFGEELLIDTALSSTNPSRLALLLSTRILSIHIELKLLLEEDDMIATISWAPLKEAHRGERDSPTVVHLLTKSLQVFLSYSRDGGYCTVRPTTESEHAVPIGVLLVLIKIIHGLI